MSEIIKLSSKSKSSMHWSVEGMLEDVLSEVKSGKRKANKAIVVFLDDEERGDYVVGYNNAGMRASECISLLRIAQRLFEEEMGC